MMPSSQAMPVTPPPPRTRARRFVGSVAILAIPSVVPRTMPAGLRARLSGARIDLRLLAHALGGQLDGLDNLGIAGAAAQVAGQRRHDLVARRTGIVLQQVRAADQEA